MLKTQFGERRTALGLSLDGMLIEVYVGPGGTYTILKTSPGRVSCLVDAGVSWESESGPVSATLRHKARHAP